MITAEAVDIITINITTPVAISVLKICIYRFRIFKKKILFPTLTQIRLS